MRKRSRLNGFPSHGVLAIGQLKRQRRRRRRRKRKRFLEDNEFLKEFVSGWSGIVFPVGRIGRAEIYRATVRPVKVGVSRVISAGGSSERYNRIKSAIVFSYVFSYRAFDFAVISRRSSSLLPLSLCSSYRNAEFAFWE